MGKQSAIQWTEATWNPVRGCSRVSEGCRHCYAETFGGRFAGEGQPWHGFITKHRPGPDGEPVETEPRWTGRVEVIESRLNEPRRWKDPRLVFVNSMSDLFHEKLAFEEIDRVFRVMLQTPQHTYQVLTKRPERASEYLWARSGSTNRLYLPNVWLGTSAEDQATLDARAPHLLGAPAALHFLSLEPLLGPVDASRYMWPVHAVWSSKYNTPEEALADGALVDYRRQALVSADRSYVKWVIVGGESGFSARPMHPAWARSLRDQCAKSGTAFFFKQEGAWTTRRPSNDKWNARETVALSDDGTHFYGIDPATTSMPRGMVTLFRYVGKNADPEDWPEDMRVREMPEVIA